MSRGPEVQRLRDAGATVTKGPQMRGQRWLEIKSEGAVTFVAEDDPAGLKHHAERLERARERQQS